MMQPETFPASVLRVSLERMHVTQVEFSRLVGVTPRAVALWLAGDRAIPGPVAAYVRVFKQLTRAGRIRELHRLRAGLTQ
jgi:hypothetical protein